jgi:hypothetical protein
MKIVDKTASSNIRYTDAYSKAKALYEEKRDLHAKLAATNIALRELSYLHADAVQIARADVPFRNRPGRNKQTLKQILPDPA